MAGNVWVHPPFPREVIEERGETKILLNEDGVLIEVPKDGHATIPRFLRPSVVTPEDWRRVKEERLWRDDPARIVDIRAIKRVHPPDRDYPLGVDCGSMLGKIRDMLKKYGKELRIMGGVDKMKLGEGREAIKAYLESLSPLVARGGFIPFCDHRCPPNVRQEDYLYYLDIKEELFGRLV